MSSGEQLTIKEVQADKKGYSITTNFWSFFLDAKWGVTPKVGDSCVLYTRGSTIQGVDLNGKKVFYKTDKQLDLDHKRMVQKIRRDREKAFKKEQSSLDARFDALPQFFQDRIRRFRENNPEFRVEFESYEMFCIEEALKILKVLKTKEEVEAFAKADWDTQVKTVTDLSDGHSGNTFGSACRLAYLYLDNPKNVIIAHGSLSVLVGSKDYGDIPNERTKLRQERRMKMREINKKLSK